MGALFSQGRALGLAVALPLAVAAFLAVDLALFALKPADRADPARSIILIERGMTPPRLVAALAEKGIVRDGRKLYRLGRLLGKWERVKMGEYAVGPGMTPLQILETVTSGVSVARPLTVHEGDNLFQVADAVASLGLADKAAFIALCKDIEFLRELETVPQNAATTEGYLFPDTYHFTRGMSAREIIHTMVDRFAKAWTPGMQARAGEMKLTRHEVVTLASIIEKETGAPSERRVISSVFHNRIRRGIRLASDPTTIYGIWETFDGNLRKKDLQEKNPYNTYRIKGLPVGPIGNPGSEALLAALNPAETPYLFFVSRNDGTHEFTSTLADHNEAVALYQKNRQARAGKSWRDLNRKDAPDQAPAAAPTGPPALTNP